VGATAVVAQSRVSVDELGGTDGKFTLPLGEQSRTLSLPQEPDEWHTYEGFSLAAPVPFYGYSP
jgi:hypothetical protein